MEGKRHPPRRRIHRQGPQMTAVDTASPSRTAAEHQQHDHRAQPVEDATHSAYDRILAGFSHHVLHVLHRPLRAYRRLAGASNPSLQPSSSVPPSPTATLMAARSSSNPRRSTATNSYSTPAKATPTSPSSAPPPPLLPLPPPTMLPT